MVFLFGQYNWCFRLVEENGGNYALMCWDNIITFARDWHNKIQSSNRFMI